MPEFNNIESAKKFISDFENALDKSFKYEKLSPNEDLSFYVIDSDYLLVASIQESLFYPKVFNAHIRELTFNDKEIKIPFKGIELFKGLNYSYEGYDKKEYLEYMKNYPWIRKIMKEKYNQWPGWLNNYIVMEMDYKNGDKAYGVGICPYMPSKFLRDFEDTLKYNYAPSNGCFTYEDGRYALREAYLSWSGEPYDKRFEKHARYYVVTATFKEKMDIGLFGKELLNAARNGVFQKEEAQTYIHPVNKWISEETLYKIVSKLYGKKNVIYQYRPSFLKSSKNGQMSYDIFIVDKNIAIEYQGKQHFEPVEIFGGEESFKDVQQRDKEKKLLSEQNGVKLIYFYYYEELIDSLIKEKIENVLK